MKIWEEFKAFALKGNIVDLAAAVILGAAFGKVVSALVDNILMPPLGWIIGGVDFSRLRLILPAGAEEVSISYGLFIQAVVNFLIVAWALFVMIKLVSRFHLHKAKPSEAPAVPPPSEEIVLLREIRDALKKS